jgi:hypothetical protein
MLLVMSKSDSQYEMTLYIETVEGPWSCSVGVANKYDYVRVKCRVRSKHFVTRRTIIMHASTAPY